MVFIMFINEYMEMADGLWNSFILLISLTGQSELEIRLGAICKYPSSFKRIYVYMEINVSFCRLQPIAG